MKFVRGRPGTKPALWSFWKTEGGYTEKHFLFPVGQRLKSSEEYSRYMNFPRGFAGSKPAWTAQPG
jgi:hypothetical protein